MLVISRQPGDSLTIGDDIKVFILEVNGDKVKIGIEAPKNIRILRSEVLDTEKSNIEADISISNQSLEIFKAKFAPKSEK